MIKFYNGEIIDSCKPVTVSSKVKLPLGRLMSALDYTAIAKNEVALTISNGNRTIELTYNKKQAKVDEKTVTLKNIFALENESIYKNNIAIEDIEVLFSYRVAYDKTNKNVVLFVTEDTPEKKSIPDTPEIPKAEATMKQKLAELKSYKVFEGDENGNLNLDKKITRAEFCKVICTVLHFEPVEMPDEDKVVYNEKTNMYELTDEGIFTDVPKTHWAYRYIKIASELELINGVGDNRFCPEENITEIDAIKIITAALGYTPMAETNGGYPDGFRKCAERFGIVTDAPDKAILREKVVEYIYTALDVPIMAMSGMNFGDGAVSYVILDGSAGTVKTTWRINLDNKYKN